MSTMSIKEGLLVILLSLFVFDTIALTHRREIPHMESKGQMQHGQVLLGGWQERSPEDNEILVIYKNVVMRVI
ncbi:unnamed protein product [Wuchereria bancrofti]|uniref:Uncharacterized protein n=1 Tax=Wuchereria bancrofti TaxID=6293 RepID=A0A3P7DWT2_WUCBA|nr:unnamed protein product [Wuchereria bancrofti]